VASPEETGGHEENATEALRRKRMALRRRYKIQEVIKRRQVLLVQVVKEERGNKGAALTTYLSLAGRYCVLMPNTTHGGGISRKISNQTDRKRLKSIMADLHLPPSMGCIVRTAGLQRTKTEIKRDFDYLTRLWDEIRDKTLGATAPALIHQDSDLIKRAIRDIYNRDIEEVLVEGEDGYRAARSFMKLLMPSHAKKVLNYVDPVPLFQRWGVEAQLTAMYHPVVQLRSGGYLVINPTEALVSIDINSGRSTREHNIEETALKTNLEAAEEIARQLRLRDMAGLVVIDFIDMESNGNVRKVERTMKEALKNDRARIQVGRISSFGLMEMSRQRLRTGVLEASTHICPTCEGTGLVRTTPSAALAALRGLEEEAVRGRASQLTLRAGIEVAIYILNKKRNDITALENRYGVFIEVIPDADMHSPNFAIEAAGPPPVRPDPALLAAPAAVAFVDEDDDLPEEDEDEEVEDEEAVVADERRPARDGAPREDGERGRRRRRRRRGGRRGDEPELSAEQAASDGDEFEDGAEAGDDGEAQPAPVPTPAQAETGEDEDGRERRRRRGRRGGRRRGRGDSPADEGVPQVAGDNGDEAVADIAPSPVEPGRIADDADEPMAEAAPKTRRRPRARKAEAVAATAPAAVAAEPVAEVTETAPEAEPARPRRGRRKASEAKVEATPEASVETAPEADVAAEEVPKPRRGRRKAAGEAEAAEKPARKPRAPRARAAAAAEEATPAEPVLEPADGEPLAETTAANDAESNGGQSGSPRRGWWQRTFGA
jgi:ribonuclease E